MKFTFKGDQIGEVTTIRPAAQEPDGIGRIIVNIMGIELTMKQAEFDVISTPYDVSKDEAVQSELATTDGNDIAEVAENTADIDYSQLTKAGLIEVAADLGVEINAMDKKEAIIEAITAYQAETTITAGCE